MKKKKFSGFAIAGFVLSFLGFFAILGIIFSIIGLHSTKNNKKRGRGLAIAGLVIGILMFSVFMWAIIKPEIQEGNSNVTTNDGTISQINSQPNQPQIYKFGDKVVTGDFAYTFNSYQTTNYVGNEYFGEKADGMFLVIDVTIENIGKESKTLWSSNVVVIDDQQRRFEHDTVAEIYLNGKAFNFEQMQPGLPKTGKIIFDVPQNLKGFIEVSDDNMWSNEKKYISWG